MRTLCYTLLLALVSAGAQAQAGLDRSFRALHEQRLQTDRRGMYALGTLGATNLVGGVVGLLASQGTEAKAFHEMNAIWGGVNLGISAFGLARNNRERRTKYDCASMLRGYEADKRIFLANAGLDVGYIAAGLLLDQYGNRRGRMAADTRARYRGFGKSIVMQGALLLVFDGVMFGTLQHRNQRWYRLLSGVCLNGDGIGMQLSF